VPLPDAAAWTEIEQLTYEKETLGIFWSGHPIDRYAQDLADYGAKTTTELVPKREEASEEASDDAAGGDGETATTVHSTAGQPGTSEAGTAQAASSQAAGATHAAASHAAAPPSNPANGARHGGGGKGRDWRNRDAGDDVSIGGLVSGLRPLKTRKGDRMCVFMLDDAGGSLEIVVFPETFKACGHLAESGQMVLVKGKFEKDDESARIIASEIVPIDTVRERLAKSVAIRLSTPPHYRTTFEILWDVFAQNKGDRRIAFVIDECDRHLRVTADVSGIRVRPSERLVSEVEKICGAGSVSLRHG
jgi:DNA polymerase III alpha subunit